MWPPDKAGPLRWLHVPLPPAANGCCTARESWSGVDLERVSPLAIITHTSRLTATGLSHLLDSTIRLRSVPSHLLASKLASPASRSCRCLSPWLLFISFVISSKSRCLNSLQLAWCLATRLAPSLPPSLPPGFVWLPCWCFGLHRTVFRRFLPRLVRVAYHHMAVSLGLSGSFFWDFLGCARA